MICRELKGQKKSKWFLQANISSKKRTTEFYFTTMKPHVDLFSFDFWRKLKSPKRHFEIDWPLFVSYFEWLFWRFLVCGSTAQPQKPIIFVIVVVLLSWRLVVMWSCHCLHFNSKSLLIRIVLLTWYAIFVFIKDSTDSQAVIRHLCCHIVKKSVRLVFYCAAFGAERLFSLFWDLFWFLYWDDNGLSLNLLSSTGNFTAA